METAADPVEVLSALNSASGTGSLRHLERLPARTARTAAWPSWVSGPVRFAFAGEGVTGLWSHQREAIDAAYGGEHVVISTGTASGKSLGYLVPAVTAILDAETTATRPSTLYIAPTKALASDQLARINALAIPEVRAATYDGDTAPPERQWVRQHANIVLTNPDMVHHSILPGHRHWASWWRGLTYVVIDECHVYRGMFGSHVSAVIRRLRRVAARYGAEPTFVLASATVGSPQAHAQALIGMPVRSVSDDGSPRAAMTVALWEPSSAVEPRRSAGTEAARVMAALVRHGVQTLTFSRSRAGAEAVAASARRQLSEQPDEANLNARIAAYRGGYLPQERRELERALRERELFGLAATNALELGIDISGLDAVVVAGWPGRRASLWQQVGRAGRAGRDSLAVLVAADDPLDRYLMSHPDLVFGEPIEESIFDQANPYVLAPHLAAAAYEIPLSTEDLELFDDSAAGLLDQLVASSILRRRRSGWFWVRDDRPGDHVSLRGASSVVSIVERAGGRVLGTIDEASADTAVHSGAVYVHQGDSFVVTEYSPDDAVAMVVAGDPGWSTFAQTVSSFRIDRATRREVSGALEVCLGSVRVSHQVVSFTRRLPSGEVLGTHPLDLPERALLTKGVWWTLPVAALAAGEVAAEAISGAAHAAEHAAIGMLPLLATCDRWDIGGVSTSLHPDTGMPTIMVYDGHPGGAGFSARAFDAFDQWIGSTLAALVRCQCIAGCPSCVQSPKCGSGNEPLDKHAAVRMLELVIECRGTQYVPVVT